MSTNQTAEVRVKVNAAPAVVWVALTTPESIKQYMFGSNVETDWVPGSPITWTGEYEGRKYQDKGTILEVKPDRLLRYSHFSPLAGLPDRPENYHTVTVTLDPMDDQTSVTLRQDNNHSDEARLHSEKNWKMMLEALKFHVEENRNQSEREAA